MNVVYSVEVLGKPTIINKMLIEYQHILRNYSEEKVEENGKGNVILIHRLMEFIPQSKIRGI